MNEALQLVARLEGECRHKQYSLTKLETQYRTQEKELRSLNKRKNALKKRAVALQRRILASASASSSLNAA